MDFDHSTLHTVVEKLLLEDTGIHDQTVLVNVRPVFDVRLEQGDRRQLEGPSPFGELEAFLLEGLRRLCGTLLDHHGPGVFSLGALFSVPLLLLLLFHQELRPLRPFLPDGPEGAHLVDHPPNRFPPSLNQCKKGNSCPNHERQDQDHHQEDRPSGHVQRSDQVLGQDLSDEPPCKQLLSIKTDRLQP